MVRPTLQEFTEILLSEPLGDVVQDHIFCNGAFAFGDWPEGLDLVQRHLCDALPIAQENVTIVGSGKIGFSLSPDSYGRLFSDDSDIDVLVVDNEMFDKVWMTLLRWRYPRRLAKLGRPDSQWDAQRRNDLYWGWFTPDRIGFEGLSLPEVLRPLRDLSTSWFNAFRSLSLHPRLATRDFSGRLYRSWDHARLYHMDGLRQVRDALAAR